MFNTVFEGNTPRCSYVGGRIANAASSLALAGLPVTMVSECADDCVGDIVVDFLKNNKVNVSSIDRYANGFLSPAVILAPPWFLRMGTLMKISASRMAAWIFASFILPACARA